MSDRPKTIHDETKLRDALSRLVDGVWRGGDRTSRTEVHQSVAPCFSIPANYDRDADLILAVAIDELVRLRETLAWLNRIGGLGLDVHKRIDAALGNAE